MQPIRCSGIIRLSGNNNNMRYLTVFTFLTVCVMSLLAAQLAHNNAVEFSTTSTISTLTQDLEELFHMVPFKSIKRLVTRYLLNDQQFQNIIRIINSNDAHVAYMRFRTQPEVMSFRNWVRVQLMMSGGELSSMEESGELVIFNRSPFWSSTVYGWQGFVNEFLMYYPQDLLSAHINMKVAENGDFSQFWTRLQSLQIVYERAIAYPEAQRVIAALEDAGVNIAQLDHFIRNLFGWTTVASAH
uniref:Uncharacterized protein n=1 Tax=Glossina austeni TaxID=7395 RepID=A0A1A9VJ53_GLOAU